MANAGSKRAQFHEGKSLANVAQVMAEFSTLFDMADPGEGRTPQADEAAARDYHQDNIWVVSLGLRGRLWVFRLGVGSFGSDDA